MTTPSSMRQSVAMRRLWADPNPGAAVGVPAAEAAGALEPPR